MPRKKAEHLKPHDFKPLGGEPLRRSPVSVKLPPELDDYVRAQSNRNQWLIAAVAEKIAPEQPDFWQRQGSSMISSSARLGWCSTTSLLTSAMITKTDLTLEDFWALPEGETAYELVDGLAIPKVSPKYFHSSLQRAIDRLISAWCKDRGRIRPEWAVTLKRNGKDWVPTPDVTYVAYNRLPRSWKRNEACPIPCDLAIEIISPGQTMSAFKERLKAQ